MKIECIESLGSIAPDDWDALRQDNHPLLSHAFLYAMEQHGCFSEQSGWRPRYLVVTEDDQLIAAVPLYEKTNSWGEFVFDHAWADAYARYGVAYYPKLVSAIPFSPVFGQKFLLQEGDEARLYPILLDALRQTAKQLNASSLHLLFPVDKEQAFLDEQNLLLRSDCQYHWRNRGYQNFDEFLEKLSRKKRKNIRQERRKIRDAGITFRRLNGLSASEEDWANFTHFYNLTYERKWGAPIFNLAFFQAVARALGEQMILVLADKEDNCIAGSLLYKSDSTLYGRHWGCSEYYDALHFETCYYQGIEICIEQGLEVFEPGAQGPHKIARGFEPVLTQSYHWLADERFIPAVAQFCKDESLSIQQHIRAVRLRSAYQ